MVLQFLCHANIVLDGYGNVRIQKVSDDRSSQSEHSEISILVKPNPSRMQVVDDTNGISSSMRINDADARTAANLNYFMDALISATDRKISVEEAVEIREISAKISKLYSSMLTQNIEYAYNANVEHRLWRECFYIPIEALRKHCNCSSTENQASHFVKEQLSLLIKEGLSFYSNVLKDYEGCYGIVIDNFLYWPCGRPTDDFCSCVSVGRGAKLVEGYIVEKTLLSVQRLLLSIGDLSRYNSMFSSSREYSSAKQWYLKALQLCFSNGRAYNQVALISLLDSKWVDAIFFFVRALGAKQPFGVAKQTLITAFNDLYKKIKVYDAQLDVKLGISSSIQQMSENALQLTDYPHEIWISASGRKTESDASEWTVDPAHFFRVESIRELYRRTVLYLLHAAGLLITKIGMENFDKISDRALSQLSALIDREECVLSSTHVLQISTLLLFAVHNSTPQHEDPDSCSLQQQKSIQMVLSLYGVLLQPIADCLDDLELALVDSTTLSPKIRNVLPAVFILSEWFSMPSVNRIYRHMPSLEPLDTSLVCVKTWKVLAQIANHLFRMEADRKLIRAISLTEPAAVHPEAVEILLPESIFLASFCDIFPTVPKSITLSRTPKTDSLPSLLAIHARFSSILSAAEYLDGSDLHCFQFDEKQNRFTSTTSSTSPAHGETVKSYEENDSLLTLTRSPSVSSDDQLDADFDEHLNFRIALKQNKAKQELLEREVVNRVFLEVRPKYLVPDTNTFIDHLQSIISIVISGSFEICVTTTVISELSCLSLPPTNKSSIFSLADDQTHENWVGEQARKAMNFLNEACQKRTPHICTVTTKGSRLATLSLLAEQCSLAAREQKALNDDLILESCIQLCSKVAIFPTGATSTTDSSRRIQRSVVLLTEDRALKIKAVCANIPCKTVPSFLKWASK